MGYEPTGVREGGDCLPVKNATLTRLEAAPLPIGTQWGRGDRGTIGDRREARAPGLEGVVLFPNPTRTGLRKERAFAGPENDGLLGEMATSRARVTLPSSSMHSLPGVVAVERRSMGSWGPKYRSTSIRGRKAPRRGAAEDFASVVEEVSSTLTWLIESRRNLVKESIISSRN